MMISIVVAVSQNNVIGNDNKLPWHLPADFKYFKKLTTGHPIIMGRSTYESIGKALPGRTNIIVTRQKDYPADGCIVVSDLKAAFDVAAKENPEEIFVIGGGEIIRQSLVWADKIYITRIFHNFDGDTFFPQLSDDDWKLTSEERHLPDQKNRYAYAFQVYEFARKELHQS